jgi:hypothetical protein
MWSDYEILFIANPKDVEAIVAFFGRKIHVGIKKRSGYLSQQSGKKSNNIFYCK